MNNSQEKYHQYLTTPYWKQVSEAVKARAAYKCQVCNSPHGLEAHHRSYEHRGNELNHLEDLTCLCNRCHHGFHNTVPLGMARAEMIRNPPEPKADDMTLITHQNYKRLKCTKEPWHWYLKNGINPKKSGWMKRAIGKLVPTRFVR